MFYWAHRTNLEFLFHNQVVLDQKAHQVPRVYQDRLGPRVLPARLEKEEKKGAKGRPGPPGKRGNRGLPGPPGISAQTKTDRSGGSQLSKISSLFLWTTITP